MSIQKPVKLAPEQPHNLSEEKDIEKAKQLGISEFMVKSNFTLDQLADEVKAILG